LIKSIILETTSKPFLIQYKKIRKIWINFRIPINFNIFYFLKTNKWAEDHQNHKKRKQQETQSIKTGRLSKADKTITLSDTKPMEPLLKNMHTLLIIVMIQPLKVWFMKEETRLRYRLSDPWNINGREKAKHWSLTTILEL